MHGMFIAMECCSSKVKRTGPELTFHMATKIDRFQSQAQNFSGTSINHAHLTYSGRWFSLEISWRALVIQLLDLEINS